LRPFLVRSGLRIVLHSGSPRELLEQLQTHTLDLVLANRPAHRDTDAHWHSHLLNEQPVSLVGKPGLVAESAPFPEYLASVPLLLPGIESEIRSAFDRWLDRVCIRPNILAEVDDMAMLRLLARDSKALALVPRVVVRDELRDGILVECHSFAEIRECFYAITPARRFPNPLVRELVWPSGTPDIAT
jgi:LysR family transcriptional activator of nhaA